MTRLTVTLALLFGLQGCAAQVESAPTLHDYLTEDIACGDAAPDLGFDGCATPVPISPEYPVATVCHCIGGTYSCFGHPGQPTCEQTEAAYAQRK